MTNEVIRIKRIHKYEFDISIGIGKTFKAYSLQECINGIEHYFDIGHHMAKSGTCPLCR
jgi:hypothetical protein